MQRRGFVGRISATIAGFAAARVAEATQPWPEVAVRRRALATARMVNTLEYEAFGNKRRYLSYTELLTSEVMDEAVADAPLFFDVPAARAGEAAIPGFSVTLLVTRDRQQYTLVIQEQDTGFAYKTDESGVIQEGSVEPVRGAFLGRPITPPARVAATGIRAHVRRAVRSLQDLLLPTADASCCGGDFYCQNAQYAPSGPCRDVCSGRCCNLGYLWCVWCCTGNSGCSCTWINCA